MEVRLTALHTDFPVPPGRFLALISVRRWVNLRVAVQLEGMYQLNNPLTSSQIKYTTFESAAKCFS
jgi:hypothetical protein